MSKQFYFTDGNGNTYPDWEQKKLVELTEFNRKAGNLDDEFFYIDLESVSNGKISMKEKITKASAPSRAQRILKDQDVLFQNVRPYQNNHLLFNGSAWESQVVASTGFTQLAVKENLSAGYLLQIFMTKAFSDEVMARCTGTSYPAINSSELVDISIPSPSLAEQQKIAEFFSALDERIALTADKVKLLKEQKQGYLQNVFNRELVFTDGNGDTYGDWEQKKLGDFASIVTGNTPETNKPEFWGGEYLWVTPSDIGDKKNIDNSGRRITEQGLKRGRYLPKGSLLITCIASIGKNAILAEEGSCNQQINAVIPSESFSTDYLYYFLGTQKNRMELLAGKTATSILNKTEFSKTPIILPSLPEQQKIAEFFSALDEQLELTEDKLALLKEQKKGYLQGIFG